MTFDKWWGKLNKEGLADASRVVAQMSWVEASKEVARLERELLAKQALIDRLMLEYCPDEMTPEQLTEWAKHQRPAKDNGITGNH